MSFTDFFRGFFHRPGPGPGPEGLAERAFGVKSAVPPAMRQGLELWYALYVDDPPWRREDPRLKPSGLPGAIGRELARAALAEFHMQLEGGERAAYLAGELAPALRELNRALEWGLCLGTAALRPCLEEGRLTVEICSAAAFSPLAFDGSGRPVAGVFRETAERDGQRYTRLEYQGFETDAGGTRVYVIRNKAYAGDGGRELPLSCLPRWAGLEPEVRIEGLERPLFAVFKNPAANHIDPASPLGVSVYGGEPTVELLRQAEEQWYLLRWEYLSGKRRIYSDGAALDPRQLDDELFARGRFTADGNLFEAFSPELRDEALYRGYQRILQRIEYNVGLSFGTLSDPQTVEKTATEILAAKNRQRLTVKAIQNRLEAALEDLVYAMDALCDLYGLAPAGEVRPVFSWGDGVLDDPETVRKDKAQDLQELAAGVLSPWEYRVKWYKETPEQAKAAAGERREHGN